ncbi:MAG: tetratricopeptide repeat protein, partial [Phaeodactylibacter sp.]|nr:tetratricopeptide repeat protein [Phaeodactylibacter sp.]
IIYNQLREVYAQMGRPVPPTPEDFMEKALQGQLEEAMALYEKAKTRFPGWVFFEESRMNWTGYQLLGQGKTEAAIQAFRINVDAYPQSFNVYDSLAEAYLKDEQSDLARKYYQKSLELNPDNENARKMLAKIEER